jgi:hypothetical protein
MFWKFAIRDLIIVAACFGCWALDAALRGHGAISVLTAVAAAFTTVLVGYLAHEWGHLAGAWLTGSKVYAPHELVTPFLFHFDTVQNSNRQFVGMSVGGFITSGLVVILLFAVLPLTLLASKLALAVVVIGVVATLILEVPSAWRVAHGAPLPVGPVYEPIAP